MAVTATDPFERLYRRYARDVYRFALSLVRNPAEAEDVTQTAFLNAFRAYERGERPERPHSWLIAIAHNAIRSGRRGRMRRPAEVPLEAAGELASPARERSDAVAVLRALGDLPDAQRDALAMRELEGRSYGEIASVLGVSVTAVESLVARGRRTLRGRRAALRGLLLLPFRHGDEAGAGFAAKAAVVVAAAGLTAGGMGVESKVIGATRHEPSPGAALVSRSHAASAPVLIAAALSGPARRPRAAATRVTRPTPPAPPSPGPRSSASPSSGPAASPTALPSPPRAVTPPPSGPTPAPTAASAPPEPSPATTTVAAAAVATPPVTAETPVATVTVPAVTVTVPGVTVTVPPVTIPVPPLPVPPLPGDTVVAQLP